MNDWLIFLLYLLTFYVIWHFAFVPYVLRSTRLELFVIRDSLFIDYHGKEEYEKLREHLNRLIRYAEEASWQRLVFNLIFLRPRPKKRVPFPRFQEKTLRFAFFKSFSVIVKLFLLRSPFLMLVLTLTIVLLIAFFSTAEHLKWMRNRLQELIFKDVRHC